MSDQQTVTATRVVKRILLPIGLPTLAVAYLEIPHPMTEAEYNQIVNVLGYCKDAMIGRPVPQPAAVESEPKE